jgi:hypothetical protein
MKLNCAPNTLKGVFKRAVKGAVTFYTEIIEARVNRQRLFLGITPALLGFAVIFNPKLGFQ